MLKISDLIFVQRVVLRTTKIDPVWLPNGSLMNEEVINLIEKRIEVMDGGRQAQADEQSHSVDMNDNFEDDLGLYFYSQIPWT